MKSPISPLDEAVLDVAQEEVEELLAQNQRGEVITLKRLQAVRALLFDACHHIERAIQVASSRGRTRRMLVRASSAEPPAAPVEKGEGL